MKPFRSFAFGAASFAAAANAAPATAQVISMDIGGDDRRIVQPAVPGRAEIPNVPLFPSGTRTPRAVETPAAATADQPGSKVVFTKLKPQRSVGGAAIGAVMTDVLSHLHSRYGDTYADSDPITHVHETTHGINSFIRSSSASVNGFYVLKDRAVKVEEPTSFRKKDIAAYIPASLRNLDITHRFDGYVKGAESWDDRPLYIWDEWVAYTNGAAAALDMVDSGKWGSRERRDALNGMLEFTVYSVAVARAAEAKTPGYMDAHPQFREFLAFNLDRAMTLYRKGAHTTQFENEKHLAYFDRLQHSADAESFRAFARDTFGQAWADRVLFSALD